MKNHALIEVCHLSVAYDGHPVLRDVNLSVCPGDLVLLVGPNGSGKTTLLKAMLGLVSPTSGSIIRCSCRPASAGRPPVIGYLPQYAAIDRRFPLTVSGLVSSGLAGVRPLWRRLTADERGRVQDVIRRMGLEGRESAPIGTLSGGQLQRALLGRALVGEPEVLLLDEPDTYLDRTSRSGLYRLLDELRTSCAVVLVSHDAQAEHWTDAKKIVINGE